ncbi:Probable membrane-associated kinase regulator 4-like [Zea mays]|uniref:Putative membrane-associated kinase regulator 4 n=1 Tax=Zea mays TaxID=4577 RepID=B4FK85_MAIZE|nr:Probable membrane-associated kinase regulator 4-like [Zea mays]ACF82528.1 unknown [Zea mays]AQK94291.1 putative membrane-associated kinase regulator 4 [Zea mays]|eukprot:NP_001136748.1 uncharacterized protein LOC100216889 [Zea mays]
MAGRREEWGGEVLQRQREEEEEEDEEEQEDEDFIDMDLSSAAARTPVAHEFEFMSAPLDRWGETLAASPADELFYKGKLLPLHLPPRIQMVEELLDGRGRGRGRDRDRDRELLFRGVSSTAPATPYESCNASPANSSCYGYGYASGELNVEEYFQEYAAGLALAEDAAAAPRKPWSRRLRFMRQLNLGLRLRASKAYLKTILFAARPGSPADEKSGLGAVAARGAREEIAAHGHGHLRAWTKNPFAQTRMNTRCVASHGGTSRAAAAAAGGRCKEREHGAHRRSFSSVIVRYSPSNKTSPVPALPPSSCSSSSASSSVRTSSGSSDGGVGPTLRRSSSASSEVENPVQGLIAYCKRSQQLASVRKSASDAGFRFLSSSASRIAAESESESDGLDELTEICRG